MRALTRASTLSTRNPLARPSVVTLPHCHMHPRLMPIGLKPANDARSGGQTKHSIRSWRVGIKAGSYGEAVASKAGQSRSAMEESGRDHVCGGSRYLQARTEVCARLSSAPAPRSSST